MTISNYGELKSAIADWLDRTDLTVRIPDFVTFAETRIHYGAAQGALTLEPLRVRAMEITEDLTVTGRQAPLPTSFLEARHLAFKSDPKVVLELMAPELFWRMDTGLSTGWPKRATIEGGNLILSPAPDTTNDVELSYFSAFEALSSDADTNWLLQTAPDVYLFAALVEAAIYTRNRPAADEYLIRYASASLALSRQDRNARASGATWSIKVEGAYP
jgi:virulence-associated protein VagC